MRKSSLGLILILVAMKPALSQDRPADTLRIMPGTAESVLENSLQDRQNTELSEKLSQYMQHPLDVNDATEDELRWLPGMNPLVARNIVQRRSEKLFQSLDELLLIEGMDAARLEAMTPFVTVRSPVEPRQRFSTHGGVRSRVTTGFETREGYTNGAFPGSPFKIYNRITVALANATFGSAFPTMSVEGGLLTEKDPGEPAVADFISAYVDLRIPQARTRILAGTFMFNSGFGLVFGSPRGIFKSSDVSGALRFFEGGLSPYRSAGENSFFRGLGIETALSLFTVAAFYSERPVHATISPDGYITGIDESGLFRTDAEKIHRNAARERVVGGRIVALPTQNVRIGMSGESTAFSHPLLIQSVSTDKRETFSNFGMDYSVLFGNVGLFGEGSFDHGGRLAGVLGILSRVSRSLEVAGGFRSYPTDFVSLHGYPLTEKGDHPANERGYYGSVRLRPGSWFELSLYYDHFVFPGGDRTTPFSLNGNDFLALASIRPNRRTEISVQYRARQKPSSIELTDELNRNFEEFETRLQRNVRLTFEYRSSPRVFLRTRAEYVVVDYQTRGVAEDGFLIYQDLRTSIIEDLSVSLRVLGFRTDSYDSRIYEFEHDVRGVFTQPALAGVGLRWYVLARYDPFSLASVWAKFARTVYDGARTIHSGVDRIAGDTESTVTIQVDVTI